MKPQRLSLMELRGLPRYDDWVTEIWYWRTRVKVLEGNGFFYALRSGFGRWWLVHCHEDGLLRWGELVYDQYVDDPPVN